MREITPKDAETDGRGREKYLYFLFIKQIYIKYINKYTVYMWYKISQ